MKKVLIFLSVLISFTASAQFMQSQQQDHTTHFGANVQGISADDEIVVCRDSLHIKYIRDAIILSTYSGTVDQGLKKKHDAHIHTLMNFNWAGGGGAGGAKGFPKGGELTTLRNRILSFFSANAAYLDGLIVVVENEPYNGQFFNYDNPSDPATFSVVQDYLDELEVVVAVCHENNIKVMDGASHMTYYPDIINPPPTIDAAKRADTALKAYRNIQLDWANYHFNAPSGMSNGNAAMKPGLIRTDALWLWGYCHHYPASNEWHQTDQGTIAEQNSLCTSIVTSQRQAHIRFAINFSGDAGSQAIPFCNLTTLVLTPLGRAYRDAIASQQ